MREKGMRSNRHGDDEKLLVLLEDEGKRLDEGADPRIRKVCGSHVQDHSVESSESG